MIHAIKKLIPQTFKNIYHLLIAVLANGFFGFPSKKIPVIAVTGTDGKTTTCSMIASILRKNGKKVALASTIEFCIGEKCEVNATKFTTLSPWKIQKFLKKASKNQCDVVILEVSSHSLDQNRIWGICPEIAVLTNITREHLDYHKTMKKYREAKQKLFLCARKHIINQSLEDIESFIVDSKKTTLYGWSEGKKNVRGVSEYVLGSGHCFENGVSKFFLKDSVFELNLHGKYNGDNALAAICVGRSLGVSWEDCRDGLENIHGVPGRFEVIPNERDITFVVDYAVTPNALKKLYETLLSLRSKEKRIIAVFGACGDRDRGKRPIMAGIVDSIADVIILTNEDPYWEDPEQILDELEHGISKKKKK